MRDLWRWLQVPQNRCVWWHVDHVVPHNLWLDKVAINYLTYRVHTEWFDQAGIHLLAWTRWSTNKFEGVSLLKSIAKRLYKIFEVGQTQ